MTKSALLKKAVATYDDGSTILVYDTQKIQDIYGYQYLIKGNTKKVRGSIHRENFLEENPFGRFNGSSIIFSTSEEQQLGSLIEWDGVFWAIERQTSYNEVMNMKHYVCINIFDYYTDFIIDTQDQANRILGANSTRYFLALESDIPILPNMFVPKAPKNITFNAYNTKTRSAPYRNSDNLIEQMKQDEVTLIASGLDTNELQEFAFKLFYNNKNFGLGSFPQWFKIDRYDKAFDLKANLWRCDLVVNYKIVTTIPQEAEHLIKKVFYNFNYK